MRFLIKQRVLCSLVLVQFVIYGHEFCFQGSQFFDSFQNISFRHKSRIVFAFALFFRLKYGEK